jgi:hypothetical protein
MSGKTNKKVSNSKVKTPEPLPEPVTVVEESKQKPVRVGRPANNGKNPIAADRITAVIGVLGLIDPNQNPDQVKKTLDYAIAQLTKTAEML